MEIESDSSLPFLDVRVTRNPDGRLGHCVYRKPTHTDRYLNASSHHHPAQKSSVINSLVHRAISISQPDKLESELAHVKKTLQNNGYNKRDVDKIINRHLHPKPNTNSSEPQSSQKTAFLPYIQGVTDRIGRILRKQDIKTIFKPPQSISEFLPSPKDQVQALLSKGVYKVPCSCGSVYIGETGRSVKTRISEHSRCVRLRSFSSSAIAEHHQNTGHKILFEESSVLAKTSHYYHRKIREAIEIFKNPNNFNRGDGYTLTNIWKPVVSVIQGRSVNDRTALCADAPRIPVRSSDEAVAIL